MCAVDNREFAKRWSIVVVAILAFIGGEIGRGRKLSICG
jgi:hypothetical protein